MSASSYLPPNGGNDSFECANDPVPLLLCSFRLSAELELESRYECGAIVNPDGLENQVEGSVVQGLGGALFEAIEFADGHLRNGAMEQYRVPRVKDTPVIDTILVDRRDIPSAGAGESTMIALAPAIGSAVRGFGRVDTALPIRLLSSA